MSPVLMTALACEGRWTIFLLGFLCGLCEMTDRHAFMAIQVQAPTLRGVHVDCIHQNCPKDTPSRAEIQAFFSRARMTMMQP